MNRTILPNCCEDWIIENGDFYQAGKEFKCLPCGHEWQKEGSGRFREGSSRTAYLLTETEFGFPYLTPATGPEPIVKRCCTKYITRFGDRVPKPLFDFECPVCETRWRMETSESNYPRRDVFIEERTGQAFVLVENPVADYLSPLP